MMIIERRFEQPRPVHSTTGTRTLSGIHELAFDSAEELCEYHSRHRHRESFSSSWVGASDSTIERWVKKGAPDLSERLAAMVEEIKLPESFTKPELSRRRKRHRGDFGNELDIHAVNQGRSDRAWDRVVKEPTPTIGNRIVHLVVDLAASSGVNAISGMWRGAVALRIYEALTRMNKSVAISAYYTAHQLFYDEREGLGNTGQVSVRIKNYGEPMREDQLAAFTSIEFLRGRVFASTHEFRNVGRDVSAYLGYPISDHNLAIKSAEDDVAAGGTKFVIGQAFTEDMAQQTLDKFCRQFVKADAHVEGFTREQQIAVWAGG